MNHPMRRHDTVIFRHPLVEALMGYLAFCALGLTSRFIPVIFAFFVLYGIAFPLVWAGLSNNWNAIGFSKRNLLPALMWGFVAGVIWAFYTYLFFRQDDPLPPLWGLQIALAIPIWLLVMSPFQEFFFRGWLQPRFGMVFGKWPGLVVTSSAFTLWHFFPKLEGTATATLPLSSPLGVISTFAAGMLFGYLFQKTENIVAPWLAHAIGGVALVLIGGMSFIHFVE